MFVEDYGKWTKIKYLTRNPEPRPYPGHFHPEYVTRTDTVRGFAYIPKFEEGIWPQRNSTAVTTYDIKLPRLHKWLLARSTYKKHDKHILRVEFIKNGQRDVIPAGFLAILCAMFIVALPIIIPLIIVALIAIAHDELTNPGSEIRKFIKRVRF